MYDSMSEITLEITPSARLDVIDVNRRIAEFSEGFASKFSHGLYCSYHTTAGYLEDSILKRLNNQPESIEAFCRSFRHVFPPGADYEHDKLDLRTELTEEERRNEPKNADSHLTFIGAGLENCVVYPIDAARPAYFIDLDGVNGSLRRTRRTTVIGYNREARAATFKLDVPMANHAISSVSFHDQKLGLLEEINDMIARLGVKKGRVEIMLDEDERKAGLTVNEYETLLMRHDLAEVLGDPLRFMKEKGRNMLRDPKAIPGKAKNYAKYDLPQVLNEMFDSLGMNHSLVERVVDRLMAMPAERFFRMKRSVTLLVNGSDGSSPGRIVHGKYQSPILVQWGKPEGGRRQVNVTITALE